MPPISRFRVPENDPIFGGNQIFERRKYSPAVTAGGLVFIAGQVGLRPDDTVPDSAEEQIRLAFERLGALLRHHGLGFGDLVELVSYHVRIDAHLPAFRAIKDTFITGEFPAWTSVGVVALARPSLLIELKAVAALR